MVIAIRIVLAQQQTVAFGLLGNAGILSTNVHLFSVVLVCSAILGCIATALVVRPTNIVFVGAAGLAIVAVAAFVESFATNLTGHPSC